MTVDSALVITGLSLATFVGGLFRVMFKLGQDRQAVSDQIAAVHRRVVAIENYVQNLARAYEVLSGRPFVPRIPLESERREGL